MRYSKRVIEQAVAFMILYGECSDRVIESLQEGDEFVLTYFRNNRTPISWQAVFAHLELHRDGVALHELAERETMREAIIAAIEEERQLIAKEVYPPT